MRPTAVEFLVHMSLAAAVSSVNSLAEEGIAPDQNATIYQSEHPAYADDGGDGDGMSKSMGGDLAQHQNAHQQQQLLRTRLVSSNVSITGASLDLKWSQLRNVEYLTDGGNNWVHTAVLNGKPVVVKTLKPECQDLALAINEIEGELGTSFPILLIHFCRGIRIIFTLLSFICSRHSYLIHYLSV
jgi:hypothetical protein